MPHHNRFESKLARDIMVTNLVTLQPETPVLSSIRSLVQGKVKGAPVVGPDRKYCGIFTERCCLNVLMTYTGHSSWSRYLGGKIPVSSDIMTRKLFLLTPEMDVFEAISLLLAKKISGTPVVDSDGCFLGVFSEKSSMDVLVGAIYDNLPATNVSAFMNTDRHRTIDETMELPAIVQLFLDTPYRRLPVLNGNRVVGQITRHDALHAMEGLVRQFSSSSHGAAPEPTEAFMDAAAPTVPEDVDIFTIANKFRQDDYRRLPVLKEGQLRGIITRKDLLRAANELLNPTPAKKARPLYFNSVANAQPPGI